MTCKCGSKRIAEVNGKTSDMCFVSVGNVDDRDYVPRDMNIGGGDYLDFSYCLDCGQMQGKFPLPITELETPFIPLATSTKIAESKDWKDRAAGWAKWRINIPKCQECGKTNTTMTLHGTFDDAVKFANDTNLHACDKCS